MSGVRALVSRPVRFRLAVYAAVVCLSVAVLKVQAGVIFLRDKVHYVIVYPKRSIQAHPKWWCAGKPRARSPLLRVGLSKKQLVPGVWAPTQAIQTAAGAEYVDTLAGAMGRRWLRLGGNSNRRCNTVVAATAVLKPGFSAVFVAAADRPILTSAGELSTAAGFCAAACPTGACGAASG